MLRQDARYRWVDLNVQQPDGSRFYFFVKNLPAYQRELPAELQEKQLVQAETDWYVDWANNQALSPAKPLRVARTNKLTVNGWAVDRVRRVVPGEIYVVLSADDGRESYYLKAERYNRPDLVKGFRLEAYLHSGYLAGGRLDQVAPGVYNLSIIQVDGDRAMRSGSHFQVEVY